MYTRLSNALARRNSACVADADQHHPGSTHVIVRRDDLERLLAEVRVSVHAETKLEIALSILDKIKRMCSENVVLRESGIIDQKHSDELVARMTRVLSQLEVR